MTARFFLLTLVLLAPALLHAELVTYEFDIDFKEINITGNPVRAMAIGDSIPAPTITGRVGDTLRVTFNNNLPVDSIVHWHGILLPHDQDGVPFRNTRNIAPNSSFTFEFPILHKGTYWYHSHAELQEQRGIYGTLISQPEQGEAYDHQEEVVMLSDWNDEDPNSVLSNLKRNGAYYAFKKDNVQAWDGVLANGEMAIRNRINQSWTRMGPMDLSDIGYDEFLVNGQQLATLQLDNITTPDRIVLRVINSSASSYFNVEYAGGPMTLLSADGVDIEPIQVQRLRMATAETYDIEVETTPGKAFEFRATSIDGTGFSSLFVGNGERVLAPDIPRPNLYLDNSMHEMDMSGDMSQMNMPQTTNDMPTPMPMPMPEASNRENLEQTTADHSTGDHDHSQAEDTGTGSMMMTMNEGTVIEYMDDYESLISREDTEFSDVKEWREIRLELTGNMERYIWSMDDRTLAEDAQIVIRKGENVRFTLVNDTMMYHPMHLHGHFFRVVNQHGNRSPLKHTVDVAPMATAVIEFEANEDKDWLFHCHNLFYMKTGMNRAISYEESSIFSDSILTALNQGSRWYDRSSLTLYSNFLAAEYEISDERNVFAIELDNNFDDANEMEASYSYYVSRFFSPFVGMETKNRAHKKRETVAVTGFRYTLSMFIEAEVRVDDEGEYRLQFESELQLSKHYSFHWWWNNDAEHHYELEYEFNKDFSLTVNTDAEYGEGVGFKFRF